MDSLFAFRPLAGALLLLVFGIYLIPTGCSEQWRHSKLQSKGVVTEGSIVGRFVGKSSGRSSAKEYHVVDVKFRPEGGERMMVSLRVTNAFYEEHQDPSASKIQVRYIPSNPTVAAIEGEPPPGSFTWIIGLALIGLALLMGYRGLQALE